MRFVVGYIATTGGADAVALGVRLARTLGAELDICMVLRPEHAVPTRPPSTGYQEVLEDEAHKWLAEAAVSVPESIETHTHLIFSESYTEGLIEHAVQHNAEAIVVGASGGGLLGSRSLGSVVNDLLESAPLPVAVAPRGVRDSHIDRVRTVTCALGDRPGSEQVLRTAIRVSQAAGIPLRLVSLVALDLIGNDGLGDDDSPDDVRERALEHARETLESAKSVLPDGFPVTSEIIYGPSVEDAVDKLEWHDGDLVMVGSGRLTHRLFLDSAPAKMLRELELALVVVPGEEITEDDE